MSAPERREPQSEAALDSRPLFPLLHPSRAEAPSTPLSRSPPAPTSPHRRPVRTIVLSLSFPLGQVRLSGPSHSPYPCLQLCPPSLSAVSVESHPCQPPPPPGRYLPFSAFLHRRYPLILYLSLSLSLLLSRTYVYLPLLRAAV